MMLKINHILYTLLVTFLLTSCNGVQVTKKVFPPEKGVTASNTNLADKHGIGGTWEGLFINGAAFTYIRLELSPARQSTESWRYTGKAYAQSFDGYLKGYSVTHDIHAENVSIQATYDPYVRTFHLQAQPRRPSRQIGTAHLPEESWRCL